MASLKEVPSRTCWWGSSRHLLKRHHGHPRQRGGLRHPALLGAAVRRLLRGIDMVGGLLALPAWTWPRTSAAHVYPVSLAPGFWRRFFITLGTWMRDTCSSRSGLRAPCARSAQGLRLGEHTWAGPCPPARPGLLVFLVVGLWHGAEPTKSDLGPLQRRRDRAGGPPRPGLPPRERGPCALT